MKRTARDVMTKAVVVVEDTAPYKEIVRLLDQHCVNALPVVDENDVLVGIVSEADLLLKEEFSDEEAGFGVLGLRRRRLERAKARGLTARDVMTSPVVTSWPDADLAGLARLLHQHNVKQVPITSPEGKVIGIVSRRDLLRVFLRTDVEIRQEILDEIVTRTLWLDPSEIPVAVSDGVVTLEGQVEQRSLAEWLVELVENVDGVVGVENRMTFRVDDQAIRPEFLLSHWAIYAPGARSLGQRGPREPRKPAGSMASHC